MSLILQPAATLVWRAAPFLLGLAAAAAWWPVLTGSGSHWLLALVASLLCLWAHSKLRRLLREQREHFLRHAPLPRHLQQAVGKAYPHLLAAELDLVEHGLRQFFVVYLRAGAFIAMPSQVADRMWHEFILDTQAYRDFCQRGFGHFFHHRPAATLQQGRPGLNQALRTTWRHACRVQGLDPRRPSQLPLLFALDTQLAIADGFRYSLDCRELAPDAANPSYCATALSGSGCGGGSDSGSSCAGDGGSDAGGGDGGGEGGGDGGGGCGGGCGGGGGD
ncbi:glycine-rich domain-containing protein [Eleftheria terrae]|uniref:glycine-rich domain-containing protein n=1 Tax=Eleftheria terrae TaxID=1597781 RepID=UPI00263AD91B|nr:hypothetical protein [Eleftheria terrae]WKB54208.1 hypothetical protein N7L95_07410 [Eleftheria terrae]